MTTDTDNYPFTIQIDTEDQCEVLQNLLLKAIDYVQSGESYSDVNDAHKQVGILEGLYTKVG